MKITLITTNGNITVIALQQEQQAQNYLPSAPILHIEAYRKHLHKDDTLQRANKPKNATAKTSIVGEVSQKFIATLRGKFRGRRKEFTFNDNYIAKITKRKKRQNINIINQIPESEFIVKRDRKNQVYVVTLPTKKDTFLQNFAKRDASQPLEEKGIEAILYEDDSSIRTRSIESSFLQNSVSLISEESEKQEEVIQEPTAAKVVPLKPKPIANKRKKVTNAEIKANQAKRARFYKFNQYEQQKSLGEHYPLTQEDCTKLQILCGREFTLNAMNEILLDMSRKPALSGCLFPSKATFMSYMTKAYYKEGRDAVKTANTGFRILARATKSEVEAYTSQAERESYLNSVEQQAITHRSDENQYRARIAGQFPPNLAYNLLTNLIAIKKENDIFRLSVVKDIELTQHHKQMLIDIAKGVGGYSEVNKLEICV